MIFKKETISLMIVLITHIGYAQTCNYSLSGQIKTEDGEPLIGATIQLLPLNKILVSDDKASFSFENLCQGTYQLVVQFVGYKTMERKITIDRSEEQLITLKPTVTELREVVVQENIENTDHAKNYSVLSEKQLAESAGKTLGESLKEISGVSTIQAGPGIFKPVIHGVHSQRVLILNHGIRQEGQQWGAEHAPEIDPFTASNIVVIKDASSIKYGTDALGGVVVINPAPLPEEAGLGGSLVQVFQSNGRGATFSGMVEGASKNWKGWGWRAQGTAKRMGDFHTPDYSLTNTGVRELDFSLASGYHGETYGIEVFFSHFQTKLGILKGTAISSLEDLQIATEREPPLYTTDFSFTIEEPRQEVSHDLLKLNSHINVGSGQLRIQYGFQQNNRKEFDIRRGALRGVPSIDLQLFTHTLETEWETTINEGKSLCVGITGLYQDNNNIYGTQQIPFIPNFTSVSTGIYAVTKIIFNDWDIDAGLRYDFRYYDVIGYDFKNSLFKSDLKFQNVSATAGAFKSFGKHHTVSFNASSAWRPPHVAELYSLGTHQSAAANEYGLLLNDSSEVIDISDASFSNEQALKVVAGYTYTGSRFTLEATTYANYIFNYIFLQPKGITQTLRGVFPYFRYRQTDALFLGADFSASMMLSKHLTASSKVSLLRASDERNNDYLVFIPSNRFELALRYNHPAEYGFYIESKFKYIAEQRRAPRVITPRQFFEASEQGVDLLAQNSSAFDFMAAPVGYGLVNFGTGISWKREKMKYDFKLSAENLLNASYREYTNRFRYYADDMGRNISLSVKCIF